MSGANFPWQVQIGPDVVGSGDGYVNSTAALFYLSVGQGNPTVQVSTTAGSSWQTVPYNELFPVSGANAVQYKYDAPPGCSFKLVIGAQ